MISDYHAKIYTKNSYETLVSSLDHFDFFVLEGSGQTEKQLFANEIVSTFKNYPIKTWTSLSDFLDIQKSNHTPDKKHILLSDHRVKIAAEERVNTLKIQIRPWDYDTSFSYLVTNFKNHNIATPQIDDIRKILNLSQGLYQRLKYYVGYYLNHKTISGAKSSWKLDISDESLKVYAFLIDSGFSLSSKFICKYFSSTIKELQKNFILSENINDDKLSISQTISSELPESAGYKFEELESLITDFKNEGCSDFEYQKLQLYTAIKSGNKPLCLALLKDCSVETLASQNSTLSLSLYDLFTSNLTQLALITLISIGKNLIQVGKVDLDPLIQELLLRDNSKQLSKSDSLELYIIASQYSFLTGINYSFLDWPNDDASIKATCVLKKALDVRKKGDLNESISLLTRAIKIAKEDRIIAELLYNQAINLGQQGKYDQAVTFFNRASELYKNQGMIESSQACRFNLAMCFENQGDKYQCEIILNEFHKSSIKSESLWLSIQNYKALCRLRKGAYREVINLLDESLSADNIWDSQKIIAYDYYIEAKISLGMYNEAEQLIAEMRSLILEYEQTHFEIKYLKNSVFLNIALGNTDALRALQKNMDAKKNQVPDKYLVEFYMSHCNAANFLEDTSKFSKNLNMMTSLLEDELDPYSQLDFRIHRAELALLQNKPEVCMTEARNALCYAEENQLNGRISKAFSLLAQSHLALKQFDLAANFYRKSMANSLAHTKTLFALTLIYYKLNNSEQSSKVLAELLASDSKLSDAEKSCLNIVINWINKYSKSHFPCFPLKLLSQKNREQILRVERNHDISFLREVILITKEGSSTVNFLDLPHIEIFDYDICLNTLTDQLSVRGKEIKDFSKSVLLTKLFSYFLENNGKSHSKEELVRYVWNEEYNPEIHDSLVYVNLHRLKTLFKNVGFDGDPVIMIRERYRLNPKFHFLYILEKKRFSVKLNARQLWILNHLKYHSSISNNKFREAQKVSARTALRDLSQMVDYGYVKAEGKGRNLIYTNLT